MCSSVSGDFSWPTKETAKMTGAKMTGVLAVVGGDSDRQWDPILLFIRFGRRGVETLNSERVDGSVVKVRLY